MGFVVPHLLHFLAQPLTDLALLTIGALLLRSRRLRWLCAIAWLGLLLLPVQQWAALPLENRFARPPPPAQVDGVIVLGGALRTFIAAERGIPALNGAAERMTELVALARRYPQARLVFSGGNASLLPGGMTEAAVARQLFDELGVPADRVQYDDRARDTWENAVFARALAQPLPGETWLLVTSAIHMPRAMGMFRKAGWAVVPWPVGYETSMNFAVAALASLAEKALVLDNAGHEWAGLVLSRLEGHSDALLPGP
jgi:uncharacterized SAM-binding protein YcdF (DUF218 family)